MFLKSSRATLLHTILCCAMVLWKHHDLEYIPNWSLFLPSILLQLSFIQVQNSLWMHWWAIGPMSLSFVFISNLVHRSQQPFTSQYILPLTSFTKGCAQYNFEFGKGLSFKSNRSSINRVKMLIPHAYATRTAGASENACFLHHYCMP